jgi:hypothetical protein
MSNGNSSKWRAPTLPKEKHCHADDWDVSVYGGFASRVAVQGRDEKKARDIYQQEGKHVPFCLPEGQREPDTHHVIRIRAGDGRAVTLVVDDPALAIEEIQVRFKKDEDRQREKSELRTWLTGREGGVTAQQGGGGETVTITGGATLCPPTCTGVGTPP